MPMLKYFFRTIDLVSAVSDVLNCGIAASTSAIALASRMTGVTFASGCAAFHALRRDSVSVTSTSS